MQHTIPAFVTRNSDWESKMRQLLNRKLSGCDFLHEGNPLLSENHLIIQSISEKLDESREILTDIRIFLQSLFNAYEYKPDALAEIVSDTQASHEKLCKIPIELDQILKRIKNLNALLDNYLEIATINCKHLSVFF